MAHITIASCHYTNSNYIVLVVLLDHEPIQDQEPPLPLGEATVRFTSDTPDDEIKKKIIKAAQVIWKAHHDQEDKRRDIERMDFPPIP